MQTSERGASLSTDHLAEVTANGTRISGRDGSRYWRKYLRFVGELFWRHRRLPSGPRCSKTCPVQTPADLTGSVNFHRTRPCPLPPKLSTLNPHPWTLDPRPWTPNKGVARRVQGFGFRVSGFGFRVSVFGFRVSCFGFMVYRLWLTVSALGFRARVAGVSAGLVACGVWGLVQPGDCLRTSRVHLSPSKV